MSRFFPSSLFLLLWFFAGLGSVGCAAVVGKAPQEGEGTFVPDPEGVRAEVWVENLEVPWSLVFLPDGRALASERPGRIRLIQDGKLQDKPFAVLKVAQEGEGGLMGLALHPRFPREPYLYAMHTYRENGKLSNRVVRLKIQGGEGVQEKVILDRIPGARFHDGGGIAFGPDGLLYICTGDAGSPRAAQDLNSLAGKILRITAEGKIPSDNPFKDSPVYSYGHRNPQGLAWHPETGDLLASEHGPSWEFGLTAHDEINVIVKGGNYGWPEAVGAPGLKEYVDPLIVWKKATPPAGITFWKRKGAETGLFVATLRSETLIRIQLKKEDSLYRAKTLERWFATSSAGKFGRLRIAVQGPDGALYFGTSNRDGRGRPRSGDDKIYRLTPK